MAVSFDLFGTLVDAARPADPAAAVAAELDRRGVPVPEDWPTAYRERHLAGADGRETPSVRSADEPSARSHTSLAETPSDSRHSSDEPSARSHTSLAETPLPAHVAGALSSRGVDCSRATARRAVAAAFDPDVETRAGATAAVEAAAAAGPVGVLSNCSVPGLAERALERSEVAEDAFDAVVTSVDCGWRKPDERAFAAVAEALDVAASDLVHVGDDPGADGGVEDAGGTAVLLTGTTLPAVADRLEGVGCR